MSGGGYGGGPVPPGAFAPRDVEGVADPHAGTEPAEWWRRAVAAIVDALVVGLVAAVVSAFFGLILFGLLSLDDPGGVAGAILVGLLALGIVAVAATIYAPLLMKATNGQTLGKMATNCRVVRGDGRDIDLLWAAYREVVVKTIVLGIAGSLTGGIAYLVDLLWPFFDDRKRALHDIVVDSRVVKT